MSETLVDGHVHLHDCFPLDQFLEAAHVNFFSSNTQAFAGVLLLAQIEIGDPLERIRRRGRDLSGTWSINDVDGFSVIVKRGNERPIVLIAGRQIVTKEKLELLSLCSSAPVESGMPLEDAVEATSSAGGIPVLPWGFGKWWFGRGRRIRQFLREQGRSMKCLLGDNGCRPKLSRPVMLGEAENAGVAVLAGSDPLPMPAHISRPAVFGSVLPGKIDLDSPTQWMKQRLRGLGSSPTTFGRCRSLRQFTADQIRLRLINR